MSYENAIRMAGATVHCFKTFGSYQGDWWAKVTWKGETGWIQGHYGSCPGCDAYESEFDFTDTECEVHIYGIGEEKESCPACLAMRQKLDERIKSFGIGYLDGMLMSQEEAEKKSLGNSEFHDSEDMQMIQYVKDNKI